MKRPGKRRAERPFGVRGDHITLGQLLKTANILASGGEAKLFLSEYAVIVNGEPEQRRGRKLRPGDLVVIPGVASLRLIVAEADTDEEEGEAEDDV